MPSHIYSMLGLWDDSIASNAAAIAIQPDYYHAADFSVYAYLQLSQDDKARALTEKSVATADRGDRPIVFANFTAKNAMPARYVLERADWTGAAVLPLKPSQYPAADLLTRFTRGLGMARSGDLAGAKAEIESIKTLRATLEKANQSYWASRSEEQILTISAWMALKEGDRDQAVKFMRAAADSEDGSIKSVAMENRLYPFRELLGELLLEMGQSAEALKEFETALRQTPNRYRTLVGIARAASGAGNVRRRWNIMASFLTSSKTPTKSGQKRVRPRHFSLTRRRAASDASRCVGRGFGRIDCGRLVVRCERLGMDKCDRQRGSRLDRDDCRDQILADLRHDDWTWDRVRLGAAGPRSRRGQEGACRGRLGCSDPSTRSRVPARS